MRLRHVATSAAGLTIATWCGVAAAAGWVAAIDVEVPGSAASSWGAQTTKPATQSVISPTPTATPQPQDTGSVVPSASPSASASAVDMTTSAATSPGDAG